MTVVGMAAIGEPDGPLWVGVCLLHKSSTRRDSRARSSGASRPDADGRRDGLDRRQCVREQEFEETMRLWAKANSREWPNIESVLILGLTDGVLLIRYFSFPTRDVEGDHWYSTLDEAKRDAEQGYGVEPTAWQAMPDEKDELYQLSVMPIAGYSYDRDNAEWVASKFTDYSPKSGH